MRRSCQTVPDFKSKIEKNPFFVLIGYVVVSVVISAGVQQYFYKQKTDLASAKCQAAVEDANSKLASIKRGISGSEYFDLRKLLYSGTDPVDLPERAKFFPSDQFYADLDDSDWDYSMTTEMGLLSLFGEVIKTEVPEKLRPVVTAAPVHLWRGKTTYDVKGSDVGRLFPFISVAKTPLSSISQAVASLATDEDLTKLASTASLSKGDSASVFASKLDKIFRGDVVGSLLYYQMDAEEDASMSSPEMGFYIVEMQKVGNVLYCQTLVTMKDMTVGGRSYPLYYIRREVMIVSTAENVYVVTIFVPSSDPAPRGKIFSAVNSWLSAFRIRIS
jgi:hypothetical protein